MIERLPPTPDAQTEYVEQIRAEHMLADRLNIVIYGPGKGEAIVAVLPDGSVGVVDGCIEPKVDEGRVDPVRELLDDLDPERLKFVALTHPHDDHYAGLGRILEHWRGRIDLLLSVEFSQPRCWDALVEQLKRDKGGKQKPQADKIRGLERFIQEWMTALGNDRDVYQLRNRQEWQVGDGVQLACCGPSDADTGVATDVLINYLEGLRKTGLNPNELSGALILSWQDAGVLLTGDMLEHRRRRRGWRGAMPHIHEKIQLINVAHHGSEKADHDPLWTRLAPDLKLAIVTPFMFATNTQPPQRHDIKRILDRKIRTVITTPPEWIVNPGSPYGIPGARRSRTSQAERNNAVAVALAADGSICRITLAGKARFYGLRPSK